LLHAGARFAGEIVAPDDFALTCREPIERYFNSTGLWPGCESRTPSEVAQEPADAGKRIVSVGPSCHGDGIRSRIGQA
jgi:hypothetical protein